MAPDFCPTRIVWVSSHSTPSSPIRPRQRVNEDGSHTTQWDTIYAKIVGRLCLMTASAGKLARHGENFATAVKDNIGTHDKIKALQHCDR